MTEQLSHSPVEHDDDTMPMRVRVNGLYPQYGAADSQRQSVEFTVNARLPKSSIADHKATVLGGEPVEAENDFPGKQTAEEVDNPVMTRAEAKKRIYDARHGSIHEGRHRVEKPLLDFTGEQLSAARERVLRVMGAASVVMNELLDTRDLKPGDNGEGEIYVGRHRAPSESRSGRKAERTNRIKTGANRLLTLIDNKWHDYREGNVPEYVEPTVEDDVPNEVIDETNVSEELDDRSKFQKLRDLPLMFAANMSTRRHMRRDSMTEEQLDDRRRYRRLAMLGAAGVATFFAVKYGHDHLWGSANDAATAGSGNGPHHLPINGGNGGRIHNAKEFLEGTKGSTHFSHEGVVDMSGWIDGHKVAKGESVWKLSKQYLIEHGDKHPSNYQIDAVKDEMLKVFKSKGLVDRKGWLKSGDIIKLK